MKTSQQKKAYQATLQRMVVLGKELDRLSLCQKNLLDTQRVLQDAEAELQAEYDRTLKRLDKYDEAVGEPDNAYTKLILNQI